MALIFFKVPYFYDNKFEAAWVTGAFNAAIRHVYIIFLAIVITGVILGYGRFLARLWNYGMYRILGRLSFTVYMIHYTMIMIVMSQQKSPLEISKLMTVAWITEVFFLRFVKLKMPEDSLKISFLLPQQCRRNFPRIVRRTSRLRCYESDSS